MAALRYARVAEPRDVMGRIGPQRDLPDIPSPDHASSEGLIVAVRVPPLARRLAFWLLGVRQPPEYRAWVAAQIARDDFARRRGLGGVVAGGGFLAVLAAVSGRLSILPFYLLGMLIGAFIAGRRSMTPDYRRRLLAYYGTTETGNVRPYASAWSLSPLRPAETAIVVTLVTITAVAGGALLSWSEDRARCRPATELELLAIDRLLTDPLNEPGDASLPRRSIVAARALQDPVAGVAHVAARVAEPATGRVSGPGVWRVVSPGGELPVTTVLASATDDAAARLTPSHRSDGTDQERLNAAARRCLARSAGAPLDR